MTAGYREETDSESPEERCRRLAESQRHLITRSQALAAGMSSSAIHRRTRSGSWAPVLPGVYLTLPVTLDGLQRCVAAVLWAAPAAISHQTAAALWRLDGFKPSVIEVTSSRHMRSPVDGLITHRARLNPARDIVHLLDVPVTTPSRTLLDLAAQVDEATLDDALDSALRRGLVSLPRLRWELQQSGRQGKRGSKTLRALIDERSQESGPTASRLENRFRRLLKERGLPQPIPQFQVITAAGKRFLDFAYPHIMLGIELDGAETHLGRRALQTDLARQNELVAMGWRLLRFTWNDVTQRPGQVAERIRHFFVL